MENVHSFIFIDSCQSGQRLLAKYRQAYWTKANCDNTLPAVIPPLPPRDEPKEIDAAFIFKDRQSFILSLCKMGSPLFLRISIGKSKVNVDHY